MKKSALLLLLVATQLQAEPDRAMVYQLKASLAKVHVVTQSGGQGTGSAVAVGKNLVATNCHVLANATGVNITKYGDSYTPVALKADWAHDVCILRFQYLDLKPVPLGDSDRLQYEQEVFSIGFPGNSPKPLTTHGKVKGLYDLDGANVVRTSSSFVMGSSGSPVFDKEGKLIALNTFKSPGKGAYFYNMPVKWIKALLASPEETTVLDADTRPFWDAPLAQRPYFMQVVLPFQQQDWDALEQVAKAWHQQSPQQVEAKFYLAMAFLGKQQMAQAQQLLNEAINLAPQHSPSLLALAFIANKQTDVAKVGQIEKQLLAISPDLADDLSLVLKQDVFVH